MNEEAGFIAALLAEPDDRTTLLVYADWLEERNDPRAECLRLLAVEAPDQRRLAQLRSRLDLGWVHLITHRQFRVGDRVRILQRRSEGILVRISDDRWSGVVEVGSGEMQVHYEVALGSLERVEVPTNN